MPGEKLNEKSMKETSVLLRVVSCKWASRSNSAREVKAWGDDRGGKEVEKRDFIHKAGLLVG